MAQARYYSSLTRRTTTTVDPGTSGTTLTVADTSSFAVLDGSFPYTLLINWGQSDQEIVTATARPSGTTFTIVRGQDGTTGQAHAIGATVDHGVSARDFNDAGSHIGASSGVHGVTGNVIGDSDTQTLSNKTINNGALTGTLTQGGIDILGAWQSYTPTWTSGGTNPTLGNGTLTGQYMLIGKTCFASLTLTLGSTTSIGSGTYLFSVPFNSAASTNYLGQARFTAAAVWIGMCVLGPSSNLINATFPDNSTTTTGVNFSATSPVVPASGNKLIASIVYPTA